MYLFNLCNYMNLIACSCLQACLYPGSFLTRTIPTQITNFQHDRHAVRFEHIIFFTQAQKAKNRDPPWDPLWDLKLMTPQSLVLWIILE